MILRKMMVKHADPIQYTLGDFSVNDFLGKKLTLEWTGEIFCIQCNRPIKKTFQQGYCFPCFQKINACNNCMIHPERCLVETGKCDPTDWAHEHCHQKHIVYLANTSGLKVGITRTKNNPSRWIDQGAIQALPIFETQNRYQAGIVEVAFKKFMEDKTNWRKMLRETAAPIDLFAARDENLSQSKHALQSILEKYTDVITEIHDNSVLKFSYPIQKYPEKLITLSFDQTPTISGVLQGIKGQYLLLACGVLNIRKFGGYEVNVKQV